SAQLRSRCSASSNSRVSLLKLLDGVRSETASTVAGVLGSGLWRRILRKSIPLPCDAKTSTTPPSSILRSADAFTEVTPTLVAPSLRTALCPMSIQSVSESVDGLRDCASRCRCVCDRVQHDEIVNRAEVPRAGYAYVGFAKFSRVSFAFVANNVAFCRDY